MVGQPVELLIKLSTPGEEPSVLDEATRQLKEEIAGLPVDAIESVAAGAAPNGAKGSETAMLGELAVTLSPAIITFVFELLKLWADRRLTAPVKIRVKVKPSTSQEIEYDPVRMTPKQVKALIKQLRPYAKP
jgi:hypothetical protein